MAIIFKNLFNDNKNDFNIKIGIFNYKVIKSNISNSNLKINFDKRIIEINDSLDSIASLRELIRSFFIIITKELNLNDEFPFNKKANLNDISFANLSWNFINWFNSNTFDWDSCNDYPNYFKVGSITYHVEEMVDISYQSTQDIQYGVADHTLGLVYIISKDRGKCVPCCIKNQTFWHEYVHCLFVQSNEFSANDIEYVVDIYATQIALFMKQFECCSDITN